MWYFGPAELPQTKIMHVEFVRIQRVKLANRLAETRHGLAGAHLAGLLTPRALLQGIPTNEDSF